MISQFNVWITSLFELRPRSEGTWCILRTTQCIAHLHAVCAREQKLFRIRLNQGTQYLNPAPWRRLVWEEVSSLITDIISLVCLCGLTSRDLWFLSRWVVEGQVQPAVADLQLQSLGLRVQLHRQQQPVWVPRPELEAYREPPCGRRRWRKRQEAAAGAQKGAGHQLGLGAREGHVALEDDKHKDGDLHVASATHWGKLVHWQLGGGGCTKKNCPCNQLVKRIVKHCVENEPSVSQQFDYLTLFWCHLNK